MKLQDILQSPTTARIADAISGAYTATGTDTYAIAMDGTFTLAYLTGKAFSVTFTNINTGASTLNPDTLGAINILKWSSGSLVAVAAGDLVGTLALRYDGTQFVLEGGVGSSGGGSGSWGGITGTITDQTDLVTYVSAQIASGVAGLMDYRGVFDASVNAYPSTGGSGSAGAILKSDFWIVSVAGTLPTGLVVSPGDLIIAKQDTPGNTQANWSLVEYNIGYTPENSANKENTTLDTSTTKYPTNRLVKEQVDLKAPLASPALTGTPTAPTASIGTNTTQIATAAFVRGEIGPLNPSYLTSPIITDTWDDLTDWTDVNPGTGSFSVSSNVLTVDGSTPGAIVLNKYIRNSNYPITNLENWIIDPVDITIGTINGTSWGVGIGVQKVATGSGGATSLMGAVLLDNGANRGKLAFYFDNSTTNASISTGSITITAGDVLTLKMRRDKALVTLYVTNNTTGTSMSWTYQYELGNAAPWTPAGSQFAIYRLGGSHTIANTFAIRSETVKNANFAFAGDSRVTGFYSSTTNNRTPDLMNQAYSSCIVIGSPGLKIEEVNAAEMLAHTPDKIILQLGVNNVGESTATVMARYATLISSLTGYTMGTNLFICTWLPATTADVTAHNTAIRTAYGTAVIDLYWSAWSGTSYTPNTAYITADGVHYNATWDRLQAELISLYFENKPNSNSKSSRFTPFYSNGFLPVGFKNTFETPIYQLDIKAGSNTSGFRLSNTTSTTGGLTMTSTSDNDAWFSGGSSFSSGTIFARATTAGIYGISSAVHTWYSNTGLTAGNSYTATARMNLGTVGLRVGDATVAHSTLQTAGSFATAYVAKTGTYTATVNDHTIECTTGTFTVTLPTAVGCAGREYFITNSGTGVITVATTSSQTFVNITATPTTITLNQFQGVLVKSNGANLLKVSGF